jgi:HAMP domain-containing protein
MRRSDMTTTTNGNGDENKASESKETTQVVKTPLPPDGNFPKLVEEKIPSFPRAGSEPLAPRMFEEDRDDAPATNERKQPWSRYLKTTLVVFGVIALLVLLVNFWRGIDQLENGQAALQTNDLITKVEITGLKTKVVENTADISVLKNQKVDPMILRVEKLAGTINSLDDKVNGHQSALDDLKNTKADQAEVLRDRSRFTRRIKKLEDGIIIAVKDKDPTPMPTEDKAAAPVAPQPTHKRTTHHYPVDVLVP